MKPEHLKGINFEKDCKAACDNSRGCTGYETTHEANFKCTVFTNLGNSGNGDDGIDCYTKGRFALLDLNYNSHQKADYYSVVAPLMYRNDFHLPIHSHGMRKTANTFRHTMPPQHQLSQQDL